ncbi:Esterase YbfF [Vibrio stylophorae]|uniref:Esterase YbfF n=1 Tax=Vibrio stylophorae TaxID=659351 RepID=A0ABM8ZUA2_9VIBR|nr:alpha/beta fold hydrolase [Vibrio stylophorae]CAH0533890.1 Esterase YbfF [Vibrio stylophorae]
MDLHFRVQGQGDPVILMHGLFGSLDNLGLLAKELSKDYQVISVDLRNHGQSPHSPRVSYALMAEDVLNVMHRLNLPRAIVIGHSMGGKVAMKLAQDWPEQVRALVVLDIAPVLYPFRRHDAIFAGLREVAGAPPKSRSEADSLLALHIDTPFVRQFLGKSLYRGEDSRYHWRFHVRALSDNYEAIMGWPNPSVYHGPALLLKGHLSEYVQLEHKDAIVSQFPAMKTHIIANTGHWLHAEKPESVHRHIRQFLTTLAHENHEPLML